MALTNLMYNKIHFDSDEEIFFAMWLQELDNAGYIAAWEKNTKPIPLTHGLKLKYKRETKLKTKIKIDDKEKILLNPSEYTPDFNIHWTKLGLEKFVFNLLYDNNLTVERRKREHFHTDPSTALFFTNEYNETWIEIKSTFDFNNMSRLFINNQKFVWERHQIFVNLVEPVALFKKTFLPLQCEPYFRYKKVPKKAQAAGKKIGDWKIDWTPRTIKEYLNEQ